ncbi:MAG TPA: ABC transporter permease [Candidatus Dormibacteraeota bacterium]|nr:ABC transporter permease [Candidatus Dormibacteraeota bacterium]
MPSSPGFPFRFVFILSVLSGLLFFLLFSPVLSLIWSSSLPGLGLALGNAEALSAIGLTVYTSALTACVAVVLGVPLGYILGRYRFRGRSIVDSIIEIPLMIPHTVAGIALITIFGSAELVGALFNGYGLRLTNDVTGIVLTLVFVSATYTVKQVEEAIKSLDPKLELVSRSLGASSTFTFFNVTLPSIWRSVVTGAILTWARASSEVGALFIMAYYPSVASILIWNLYAGYGLRESISNGAVLSPGAVNVAALMIFINLAIFILFKLVQRRRGT